MKKEWTQLIYSICNFHIYLAFEEVKLHIPHPPWKAFKFVIFLTLSKIF